jgi:hypothetical protein
MCDQCLDGSLIAKPGRNMQRRDVKRSPRPDVASTLNQDLNDAARRVHLARILQRCKISIDGLQDVTK